MFLEQVEKWKCKTGIFGCEMDEDYFDVFYQENSIGKNFMSLLAELGYQIYELQICIEGLIEDIGYGQEDKKIEEDVRQRHGIPCERRCASR